MSDRAKLTYHPLGEPKSRKPIDQELSELVRVHAEALRFDNDSGTVEDIFDKIASGVTPRGIAHKHTRNNPEKQWVVKFSMSGRQYYLGAHNQHTAARLYDCLLVALEIYRKQKPSAEYEEAWFNFSRAQAETDLAHNNTVKAFIFDLTEFWKKRGVLKTPEDRADKKAEREKAYAVKRSTAQAVENWGADLRVILFEMQNKLDTLEQKLDELRRCVTIPTIDAPPHTGHE